MDYSLETNAYIVVFQYMLTLSIVKYLQHRGIYKYVTHGLK